MPRKLLSTAVILSVVGLIVAVVRAQDGADSNDGSPNRRLVDSGNQERSILTTRPSQRTAIGSGLADPRSDPGRATERGRLAERLQQLRRSVTGEPAAGEPAVSTASRPGIGRPARLSPVRPIESGNSENELSIVGEPNGEPPTLETQSAAARSIGGYPNHGSSARRQNRAAASGASPSFSGSSGSALPRQPSGAVSGALLDSPGPALQVTTTGPPAILHGKSAEFTITLANQGTFAAEEVFVRVGIPIAVELDAVDATAGATEVRDQQTDLQQLVWKMTQVAGRSQERLTLKVTPRESQPFDLSVDWTLRSNSATARIEVQRPQLELAVFGPEDILYGTNAVYTLQLSNPGTGSAENVAVEFGYGAKNLPTKQIGLLEPGEQTEISVELTAREAGLLRVAAVATAAGGLRAEATEEVRVRRAQIQVEVLGPPLKFAGGVGTFQVHVRNTGDAQATDVMASVLLPPGAEYVTGDMSVTNSGGLVTRIGQMEPGTERVFRVQSQLTTPGENRIEARVQASDDLAAAGSFVSFVKALADLKLVVNDPSGPTPVGTEAEYEVTIVNRGTKAASQVTVVVQFSEGVEPIEASRVSADIVPGQILFRPIPRIGAGEKITLKIKARADHEGNHRFRAEVRCAQPETVLVAEESTYFFADTATAARSTERAR